MHNYNTWSQLAMLLPVKNVMRMYLPASETTVAEKSLEFIFLPPSIQ